MSDQDTRERRQRSRQFKNRHRRGTTDGMRHADRHLYEEELIDPMEAAYEYMAAPKERDHA